MRRLSWRKPLRVKNTTTARKSGSPPKSFYPLFDNGSLSVFAYHYALAPVRLLTEYEAEINKYKKTASSGLEILFHRNEAPFDVSIHNWKQLCIGVRNSDPTNTAEDVSVRLERIEPHDEAVPLLEFRELIFPFARQQRRQDALEAVRSVNLNPLQTRYFEIVFTYGGAHIYELCFVPTNFPLKNKSYLIGIRVTGKDVRSEHAEFQLGETATGEWSLERRS
jgi:hypothetical protein